ncbi:MAG: glycoside hydrolase family 18 protein [Akkermansia sp.]|nr:glycoside hydrolase family 18 protein [Akkermansia sp.]
MKSYYYLIPFLALPLQAITVETRPTHGVFYAGLEKQVCMQIKVDAAAADVNKKITSMSFSTGKTTSPADITKVRLYKSSENAFTLNTGDTNRKAVEVASGTLTKGSVNFTTDITIDTAGTSYYWLVYDIAGRAKGNNKIDGVCTAFAVGGATLTPTPKLGTHVKERVYGTVYPFKYRIVPYYRTHWINVWAANHLNATHFKSFTDIIHFGYSLNADGTVANQWYAGDVADPMAHAAAAREKLKKLRGTAKSRIIAGFGHVDDGLTAFYRNTTDRTARKAIAKNMAKLVLEGGYDGVDIDWEYPDNGNEWVYLTYMLADLRDELAGSGVSISMAATLFYMVPWHDATDQVDFINTMSYDQQSTQHSPMSILQDDANRCVNTLKMPKAKVVLGLPFYTNRYYVLWDQVGWNTVVNQYPNISPSVNQAQITSANGTTGHSFNGANLIKEKCKWVKNNGYGGVMIWAYDTDVQLTHKMSLGKAMYSVIKQTKR